jgi:hypothetical protein
MAILASCSAQKKHDRIVKYHPEVCVKDTYLIKDTIIKTVKVPVPEYKDSFIFKHDTTYETKQVVVYKKGDRIFLRVKADTITYTDSIPYEVKLPGKTITKEYFNWWYLVISFFIGIIATLFLRK